MPEGLVTDPDHVRIVYDDLDRFSAVFGRLAGAADSAAVLDSMYLAAATPGLRAYARVYGLDGAVLAAAIARGEVRYGRVAAETPARVRTLEPAVRRMLQRYHELYAAAIYPPIFYLVAHHRAGGAVQREGVLIATEVYTRPAGGGTRPGGKTLDDLVHLVAHELTHYQQAAADPERYQRTNSLLARAIKEGSADFIAELASGGHINEPAHAYGLEHEWTLWSRFRCEMHGTETGDWFFTRPAEPDWPQDLGYFIGYRIARAFFDRQPDAHTAIAAIIRAGDYAAFLEASGYEEALREREAREFPGCDAGDAGGRGTRSGRPDSPSLRVSQRRVPRFTADEPVNASGGGAKTRYFGHGSSTSSRSSPGTTTPGGSTRTRRGTRRRSKGRCSGSSRTSACTSAPSAFDRRGRCHSIESR